MRDFGTIDQLCVVARLWIVDALDCFRKREVGQSDPAGRAPRGVTERGGEPENSSRRFVVALFFSGRVFDFYNDQPDALAPTFLAHDDGDCGTMIFPRT